jgi:hypothetical protein
LLIELIPAAALALAIIALVVIFRRERLSRDAGQPSQLHPFRLGIYRGCAFVVFLFVAYVVLMVIIRVISGPPTF